MDRIIGMILAGGRVDELLTLTEKRPKAAVPVFGIYRFIDFVLSNMMHSRIDNVGVLSQYRPYSLMRHIGNGEHWDFIGRKRGIRILPPYKGLKESDWYRGTADAVYQNISFIEEFKPEMVIIAAADHIYHLNYQRLIQFHKKKKADVTVCFTKTETKYPWFGYGVIEKDGRLIDYKEKPEKPVSEWVSMTIYLFQTELLIDLLKENAQSDSHEFGRDIIPHLPGRCAIYGYKFNDYWSYARTIEMYYNTNMEFLNGRIDLKKWQVCTNLIEGCTLKDRLPARIEGKVVNSYVGDGCIIKGNVINSIISPGVVVEEDATVENSIIFHHTIIKNNARLKKVICDKDCIIGENVEIGFSGEDIPSREFKDILKSGITVLGKGVKVSKGIKIGANTVIYAEKNIEDNFVEPGSSIR
ncbi:MAG: glucose-1-phosphate adenylyltransferase subunit GlgD [candidate division WOR-3 bacterium]|nr:glucose-1-phosphate adenylyltransferase subunit GlgD [candidate division WOR-3 bacterium]